MREGILLFAIGLEREIKGTMDKNLLYTYFEGKTSELEEKKLRSWLEASPENKKQFRRERKLYNAMLLVSPSQKRLKRIPLFSQGLKYAALILLTFSATLGLVEWMKEAPLIAQQTIHVPAGERINIILPDSTNVWLNAKTTFTYPTDFNQKKRVVALAGEAYFEVAHNAKKPFVVRTEKYDVKVLGTHFNVEAYANNPFFETTLMSGKVEIEDKLATQKIQLTPNQKASSVAGKLITTDVNDFSRYRWKEGLICFKDFTLSQMLFEFEKYYDLKVEIKNKQVLENKHTFEGKFRLTDGVAYALLVLQRKFKFTYTLNRDQNSLLIE